MCPLIICTLLVIGGSVHVKKIFKFSPMTSKNLTNKVDSRGQPETSWLRGSDTASLADS